MFKKSITKILFGDSGLTKRGKANQHASEPIMGSPISDADYCMKRLVEIENKISLLMLNYENLKQLLEEICDTQHNKIKLPHRCPVCNGNTFDEHVEFCHICDGRGIVWG